MKSKPAKAGLSLAKQAFQCMQIDEKYSGLGIKDFRYNAIIIEELARTGSAGPAVECPPAFR